MNIKGFRQLYKVPALFLIAGACAIYGTCHLGIAGAEGSVSLPSQAKTYTVRGTITSREYQAGSDVLKRLSSYIFSVKARMPQYVIHTRKVMGELENEITSQYVIFDGRDVFHIKEFDAPPGGGILVSQGMFPYYAAPPAQWVWFALVSQPYLASVARTDGIPFRDIMASLPIKDAIFRWTLSTNSPHLPDRMEVSAPGFFYEHQPHSSPRKVRYRNAYRNGYPLLSYACYGTTNINDFYFPLHFEVRRYGAKANPMHANDVNLLIVQEYRVTEISLGESTIAFIPDITRDYLVSDFRFKNITGEIPVLYTNTNTYYRATNDPVVLACLPAAVQSWQNIQRHTAGAAPPRLTNGSLIIAVVFIAMLLPLGALWWRVRRDNNRKIEQLKP